MLLSKITAHRSRLFALLDKSAALANPASWIVAVTLVGLAGLRLLYLSADFPNGIDSYGMTYTDEGWWARNAIAFVREGQWYIDDGYNTVFNLPVLPLIQVLWFKIFGISLTTARSITVVCTVAISGLVYAIARRTLPAGLPGKFDNPERLGQTDDQTDGQTDGNAQNSGQSGRSGLAWLAPFIVLSSYPVFIYSRLALLEMPMLMMILISLWLMLVAGDRPTLKPLSLIGSAVFLGLAVLTKTSALFALPMLCVLIYLQPGRQRQRLFNGALFLLVFVGLVGLFSLLSSQGEHALSYAQFSGYNVVGKVHRGLFSILKGPLRVLKYSLELFPLLLIGLGISLGTLMRSRPYRANLGFQIALLWSLFALVAFSVSNYAAPRYFVIWIVPIALAIPLAIDYCLKTSFKTSLGHTDWRKTLLISVFLLSTIISLGRITIYITTPNFTLVNLAQQVEATIQANPDHSPVVMGHFADTLALVENIKAINDQMGFRELDYRIETFNPGYYLSVGKVEGAIAATLDQYYQKQLLEKLDLYQNYDYGQPVFFYQLDPSD